MIILAVNNSNGSALSTSRKCLSKFLFQISNDSYIGKMSYAAVELMISDLKKTTQKNTSIQLYKIYKNKFHKLCSIGNSNNISNGIYSFKEKTMTNINPTVIKSNIKERLLKNLTIFSGLFHDFGKNTIKFQEKLKNQSANNADYIRHELISYLFLKEMEKSIIQIKKQSNLLFKKKDLTDIIYFEFLSSIDNVKLIFSMINQTFNESLDTIIDYYSIDEKMFTGSDFLKNSFYWLVLTHHKLTDSFNEKTIHKEMFNSLNVSNLINNLELNETQLKNNLTLQDVTEFYNEDLLSEISKTATKISGILKEVELESYSLNDLFYYIVYLCRPVLILSDYMGSNDKEISTQFEKVLANTKNGLPADTLSTHLIKVAKYCSINFKDYCVFQNNQDLHKFNIQNATNKILDEFNIIEDSFLGKNPKFRWQQDIVNKILFNNQDLPTFGVIISETGTGKTRAIPKILTSLSQENVRYNLLLGLKSLTDQTYKEYIQLGLKNNVNCLIGGSLQKPENTDWKLDGVFHDINKEYNFELTKLEKIKFEKNNGFYTPKEKNILQKPIIVATIDHFINHGSLSNGSTTNLYLRTISSDLVLDEIDNYSLEQLNIISRLIFVSGLYGRNVLISSATAGNILVENLYNIYKLGLKSYFSFKNQSDKFNYLCVSNFIEPSFIKTVGLNTCNFINDYKEFLLKHIKYVDKKETKQTIKPLDISNILNLTDAYQVILNNVLNLHADNNEAYNNKKISVGFVKFNLIENTIDFAKFLKTETLPEDTEIFIICYHSKFILNDKIIHENILNGLKRKTKQLAEIEFFGELIKKSLKKNIIFIVSTSPIIEIGKDQDYDWCINDPSTTEAQVQIPGRVRRHRDGIYLKTNCLTLSKPISKLMNINNRNFHKTFINNKPILNNYNIEIFNNLKISFQNIQKINYNIDYFPTLLKNNFSENVSNKYCLLFNPNYDDNVLRSVENIVGDLKMNNNDFQFYFAQNKYIETYKTCLMSNKFMKIKFRQTHKIITLINDEYFIDKLDNIRLTNIKLNQSDECSDRFLVNNFKFNKKPINVYNQLNLNSSDDNNNLEYSHILGLIINKQIVYK